MVRYTLSVGAALAVLLGGCASGDTDPDVGFEPPVVNADGTRDSQEACVPQPDGGPASC